MRPRALDLFCGAGGVSVGLARAGFDVVGVDADPKCGKHWEKGMEPYGGEFRHGDALQEPLDGYALVWASPPCQAHSALRPSTRREYVSLIEPMRERLQAAGAPYVMENVPGAPLRWPFMLCGASFGLGALGPDGTYRQLRRHRLFESSLWHFQPPPCGCNGLEKVGVYGGSDGGKKHRGKNGRRGGYQGTIAEKREAMGIDWMPLDFINEAIPPAYAEWIGRQAREALGR